MRVAFLLERPNYYRLFGPIVDRALERAWETECWHDSTYPQTWLSGSKSPATILAYAAHVAASATCATDWCSSARATSSDVIAPALLTSGRSC